MADIERRLTIEKNRAKEMGKLAHANACEAMEYRRLLTIARAGFKNLIDAIEAGDFSNGEYSRYEIKQAKETLTQTAPKQ